MRQSPVSSAHSFENSYYYFILARFAGRFVHGIFAD